MLTKSDIEVSIVVPVYNASKSIEELVRRVEAAMSGHGISFELILTEDFSGDNSWEKILEQCNRHKWIVGLKLAANAGQWKATLVGMSKARGNYIVTIDDDLEYAPEDIITLYRTIKRNNFALVFGMAKQKYKLKGEKINISVFRNKFLNCFWRKPPTDSFKILTRNLVFYQGDFIPQVHFEAYIGGKINSTQIGYCEVSYHKRLHGQSNHSLLHKIRLFIVFSQHHFMPNHRSKKPATISETVNL